mgnify:CR=1 FL=1
MPGMEGQGLVISHSREVLWSLYYEERKPQNPLCWLIWKHSGEKQKNNTIVVQMESRHSCYITMYKESPIKGEDLRHTFIVRWYWAQLENTPPWPPEHQNDYLKECQITKVSWYGIYREQTISDELLGELGYGLVKVVHDHAHDTGGWEGVNFSQRQGEMVYIRVMPMPTSAGLLGI